MLVKANAAVAGSGVGGVVNKTRKCTFGWAAPASMYGMGHTKCPPQLVCRRSSPASALDRRCLVCVSGSGLLAAEGAAAHGGAASAEQALSADGGLGQCSQGAALC